MICSHLSKRVLSLSGGDHTFREQFLRTAYSKYPKQIERTRNHHKCYGSIYNVEFTPNNCNTVLVSLASGALALYDTRLEHKVSSIAKAHDDGVNVISFLDSFLIATGSDDQTIKVWDLRMMSANPVAVLNGHKGWVKSIEIDRPSNSIFSMAFNDGVRRWDMNRLDSYDTGQECNDNLLFGLPDGVRMRISPDSSVMIISLRKDHLVILKEFDGESIEDVSNMIPQNYPLSHVDQVKLRDQFKHCKKNIVSVHLLNQPARNYYRTPLSLVCHPREPGLIAMRGVDIAYNMLIQELTILYGINYGDQPDDPYQHYIETNQKYLKVVEEVDTPDSVMDYIKEIAFSVPDGRVLVSPCGYCVRLLSINKECTPMEVFYDKRYYSQFKDEVDFEEITVCSEHKNGVLTCRLNSDSMCLVSGCVDGEVVFNWPRL